MTTFIFVVDSVVFQPRLSKDTAIGTWNEKNRDEGVKQSMRGSLDTQSLLHPSIISNSTTFRSQIIYEFKTKDNLNIRFISNSLI